MSDCGHSSSKTTRKVGVTDPAAFPSGSTRCSPSERHLPASTDPREGGGHASQRWEIGFGRGRAALGQRRGQTPAPRLPLAQPPAPAPWRWRLLLAERGGPFTGAVLHISHQVF